MTLPAAGAEAWHMERGMLHTDIQVTQAGLTEGALTVKVGWSAEYVQRPSMTNL